MKKPTRTRKKSEQQQSAIDEAAAEPKKRLNIEIPQSLHTRMRVYAAQNNTTMQAIAEKALESVIDEFENIGGLPEL